MAQHKKPFYKPTEVPNPFLAGSDKAYAEILLDKTKEAQMWRHTSYAHIGLFFIALIFFFVSIARQQTVPVLVNIMPDGEAQYLGPVKNGAFTVPEAAVLYFIRKFVYNLRSISTDYQVLYLNIDDCFHWVTKSYEPIMRNNILSASPFDLVGKTLRTVEIESVLHVIGRSYQINWTETVFEPQTNPKKTKMRAVVTIKEETPTPKTIERNPLGIYVENFEVTELQ